MHRYLRSVPDLEISLKPWFSGFYLGLITEAELTACMADLSYSLSSPYRNQADITWPKALIINNIVKINDLICSKIEVNNTLLKQNIIRFRGSLIGTGQRPNLSLEDVLSYTNVEFECFHINIHISILIVIF